MSDDLLSAEAPTARLTSDDICAAIRKRFPAPEYATLFEVANATGFEGSGYCDAVVVGLWPSRGLHLHGMEIKVSRADWLREMKAPGKAEAFARYCDRWSLVVPAGVEIVKPMELPPTWGMATVNGRGIQWTKEPTARADVASVDRRFLAALLRANENVAGVQRRIDTAIETERGRIEATLKARVEAAVAKRLRDDSELRKRLETFEAAAGIKIDDWRAGEIGKAVKIVLERGETYLFDQARHLRDRLDALLADPAASE